MAVQVLSDFTDALSQLFDPMLQRQMNRETVLLALLMKRDGRGKNVAWDVKFSGITGGSTFTEGADVGAGDLLQDTNDDAILSWGQYRRNFGLSGLATAAASTSPGSANELLDMIVSDGIDSASKLVSDINGDLYDGTTDVIGLQSALAATGTYATIAKASEAEWAGNVDGNSGTPRALTKTLLDTMEATIFRASGLRPHAIVTTPEVATKFEGLFDAITRQVLDNGEISAAVRNLGAPAMNNIGFTGLHYKGMPVYRDIDCPAEELYFINIDKMEVRSLPQFARSTATSMVQMMLSDEKLKPTGLSGRLEALAKVGDSDRFTIKVYTQLCVKRVNAHGLIEDIDES